MKSGTSVYSGNMINISAGGFSFSTMSRDLNNSIGETVEVTINDFELLNGSPITGVIMRSTDSNGRYILGCRMEEDNKLIYDYINTKRK